jgi:hypothetical protein
MADHRWRRVEGAVHAAHSPVTLLNPMKIDNVDVALGRWHATAFVTIDARGVGCRVLFCRRPGVR